MSAFDRLAAKLAKKPGVNNPRALAATIGRKKVGNEVMSEAARRGVAVKTVLEQRRRAAR